MRAQVPAKGCLRNVIIMICRGSNVAASVGTAMSQALVCGPELAPKAHDRESSGIEYAMRRTAIREASHRRERAGLGLSCARGPRFAASGLRHVRRKGWEASAICPNLQPVHCVARTVRPAHVADARRSL